MEIAHSIIKLLMIIPLGIFTVCLYLLATRKYNRKYAKWRMISSITLAILLAILTIMSIVLDKELVVQAIMIFVWIINAVAAWVEYKKLK